jgi:hypothetical protein
MLVEVFRPVERIWTGRVQPGAESEHDQFVAWLASAEGQSLLARSLLASYQLREQAGRLSVTLGADEPPAIVKFLRNRRFWPDFWAFESAERANAVGPDARQRVTWSR